MVARKGLDYVRHERRRDSDDAHRPEESDWVSGGIVRGVGDRAGRRGVWKNFWRGENNDDYLFYSISDRSVSARGVQEVCGELGKDYSAVRRSSGGIIFALRRDE